MNELDTVSAHRTHSHPARGGEGVSQNQREDAVTLGVPWPPQLHAEKERAALCSFQRPGLPVASVGALQEARQDLSILPAQSFLV